MEIGERGPIGDDGSEEIGAAAAGGGGEVDAPSGDEEMLLKRLP
jgi:hypothetical protein